MEIVEYVGEETILLCLFIDESKLFHRSGCLETRLGFRDVPWF
jgi:hypothetical protein